MLVGLDRVAMQSRQADEPIFKMPTRFEYIDSFDKQIEECVCYYDMENNFAYRNSTSKEKLINGNRISWTCNNRWYNPIVMFKIKSGVHYSVAFDTNAYYGYAAEFVLTLRYHRIISSTSLDQIKNFTAQIDGWYGFTVAPQANLPASIYIENIEVSAIP